jgi:ribosomal protein L11 methyltransferase
MPYRIDLENPPEDALERLVELGALDIDRVGDALAAIMPDGVELETVERALERPVVGTTTHGRDDGSVWVLQPREVRVGRTTILPADRPAQAGALRMIDGPAFGTGLHASTELCLEGLAHELLAWRPASILDVGTGSGILALAALCAGVPRAVGIDIDADAVRVAAENARINGLTSRFAIVRAGPDALSGRWPLVMANVLAAPLIQMAPALARCVGRGGRIVLSGVRSSLARDVAHAYDRVGMRMVSTDSRRGWSALTLHASW